MNIENPHISEGSASEKAPKKSKDNCCHVDLMSAQQAQAVALSSAAKSRKQFVRFVSNHEPI